ncbi:hypothetical protein [Helicobacter brantae]|uniref:Uncharacterized protein n=1 Tax=Helicobacter brantae TaxID=375927 RepID=A0A3D8IVI5_9HELI|nr:hypothetical protein [Helicobacter brantae]RDU68986.1 hypothetical protein CQA58_07655 [Helicobacter brantae]
MQINSSFSMPSYYAKEQDIQSQYLKTADLSDKTKVEESTPPYEKESYALPRQTYGLVVLEKMTDDEYHAFLRATAEMSESEKIMAAQSLYRLNELQRDGLLSSNKNPYSQSKTLQNFPQIFQNAYSEILAQKQNV